MKKKSVLTIATSVVLTAVIGIGSTLAYMSAQTDVKQNVFTSTAALQGQIKETNFDAAGYGEKRDDAKIKADPGLGINKAKAIVPGLVIKKDPMVKNSTADGGVSAWIAVKLDITGAATLSATTDKDKLANILKIADVDFDNTNWLQDSTNPTVFYFKDKVDAGKETKELFKTVTIKSQKIGDLNPTGISIDDVKDFQIDVKAALIQATGTDVAESPITSVASQNQLKSLLGVSVTV